MDRHDETKPVDLRDVYDVYLYDCAGEYWSASRRTFTEALTALRVALVRWPDKHGEMYNRAQVDLDCSGLTEDEQEDVDCMIHDVKKAVRQ